jgi:hypothetical protein
MSDEANRHFSIIGTLIVIVLLAASVAVAQPNKQALTSPPELENVLTGFDLWVGRTLWSIAVGSIDVLPPEQTEFMKISSNTDVVQDLSTYTAQTPSKGEDSEAAYQNILANHALITPYKSELTKAVSNFTVPGKSLAQFLYPKGDVPVRVASKDGKNVVLFMNVRSSLIFSTRRLTSKGRAAKTIEWVIVPSAQIICKPFWGHNTVSYVGMTVLYGSKNFAPRRGMLHYDEDKLEGEAVALVTEVGNCKKLMDGEITQEEFVQKLDIFLSDRDMVRSGKKVILPLAIHPNG